MTVERLFSDRVTVQRAIMDLKEHYHAKVDCLAGDLPGFFRFCFGFTPTDYQAELIDLFEKKQFVAARWPRQSGKSMTISALLLKYALDHPDSYIGVVGPSWRQTKLNIKRITRFLHRIPSDKYLKPGRTVLRFANGSVIEAFPNNPDTIRGPTLNCLPGYVKVTLSDGAQVPISKIKRGCEVLSFNPLSGQVESKRVLRAFLNPLAGRRIVRVFHDFGHLDCTEDHKIYSLNSGYVAASSLTPACRTLCFMNKIDYGGEPENAKSCLESAIWSGTEGHAKAVDLRWPVRRSVHEKTSRQSHERHADSKSLFRASRIRSVQVLANGKLRQNSTEIDTELRLGKDDCDIQHSHASRVHRDLQHLLSQRSKDNFPGVAFSDPFAPCVGSVVHGRWLTWKGGQNEDKHLRVCIGTADDSGGLAEGEMGCGLADTERYEGSRILSLFSGKESRLVFRSDKRLHRPEYAVQNPSQAHRSAMQDMWKASSASKGSCDKWEKRGLQFKEVQGDAGKTESGLETEGTETLQDLWCDLHAYTGKGKGLFTRMQEIVSTPTEKGAQNSVQEAVSAKSLYSVLDDIHSDSWQPKSMQSRMPHAIETTEQRPLRKEDCEEGYVYDIEVADNHNFFADGILVSNCVWWDETNFTANDVDLYDAVLFTLGTTNGKLICTSTPWSTDSLFWKMCNHRDFEDFGRHHVSWERAQEPNGPLKKEILDRIRKQFGEDPARWRREMEAEWAEDENAWLPQSLIVSSIGTVKNCGEDLQLWNPEVGYSGDLFVGLDLAQVRDYCVLSVFDRVNDVLFLRHLKIFSQPTKYANVLGYLKTLQDRWDGFQKIRVDFTKEGPSIISDMEDAGIENVEGVTFSVPRKSEMASLLKQRMMNQHLFYPHLVWEKPYRSDICTELNVERYELRKDGTMALNHPTGTHDDVFWSLALGVYATVDMKPLDFEGTIRFG
jgi:hypothetical protein